MAVDLHSLRMRVYMYKNNTPHYSSLTVDLYLHHVKVDKMEVGRKGGGEFHAAKKGASAAKSFLCEEKLSYKSLGKGQNSFTCVGKRLLNFKITNLKQFLIRTYVCFEKKYIFLRMSACNLGLI